MKKKLVSVLLTLMVVFSLAACGFKRTEADKEIVVEKATNKETVVEKAANKEMVSEETADREVEGEKSTSEEPTELIIFAAASMTETLTKISELYKEENPNVELIFNFDSSGTLKTQIQEGAKCDLFISAGQKQMNQIDVHADSEINKEGLDYVLEGTRIDLLENKVTLCVSEISNSEIENFDDLAAALKKGDILMAMGNSDVPVGQYTQKILAYYELDEEELTNTGVISYGTNAKEVTTQISEGSVDCGVIYGTDAVSAGLIIKDFATAEMCGQVIYPAAVLNVSENQELATGFLEFIQKDACMEIFEEVGFSRVQ